jgi:hypothetical protein
MPADLSNFIDRQAARLAAAHALGSTLPRRPSSQALIHKAPATPALVADGSSASTPPQIAPVLTLPSGEWLINALDDLSTRFTPVRSEDV